MAHAVHDDPIYQVQSDTLSLGPSTVRPIKIHVQSWAGREATDRGVTAPTVLRGFHRLSEVSEISWNIKISKCSREVLCNSQKVPPPLPLYPSPIQRNLKNIFCGSSRAGQD